MEEYSVLIIDDDVWMQRILSKTLQSYGFKKSYLASNGFEGIELAVEYLPTLIVLDILMPELSGHLTLKILKHIKATKNIPVLMVSALSDIENLGLAVKSGTAGFISKPFTRATIYDKLISVFGKDQLDRISRGGELEELDEDYEETAGKDMPGKEIIEEITVETEAEEPESDEKSKPLITHDQLLQHYHDDEKRSIESIKKLLLKSKK